MLTEPILLDLPPSRHTRGKELIIFSFQCQQSILSSLCCKGEKLDYKGNHGCYMSPSSSQLDTTSAQSQPPSDGKVSGKWTIRTILWLRTASVNGPSAPFLPDLWATNPLCCFHQLLHNAERGAAQFLLLASRPSWLWYPDNALPIHVSIHS